MVMNPRTQVRLSIVSAALCLAVHHGLRAESSGGAAGCRRRRAAAGTRRHGGTDPDSAALHARADCGGSGATPRLKRGWREAAAVAEAAECPATCPIRAKASSPASTTPARPRST